MPLLPWGAYQPDTSDYESTTQAHNILNVYPRSDGYGPWPSFAAATSALPAACRGAFYALKSDGTVTIFAGTVNKLYQLNNTTFGWTDVSLGGGSYSSLSSTAQWQFAQTGTLVFATQANNVMQVFDTSSATAFSNALGSPPQAAYVSVVGRFLVLSGLTSQPYRICWSGLGDFNSSTSWTFGTNSSDFQDFPDGGIVRGVGGGEFGTVFQDQAIRRMSYIPGSDLIFQIERVTQDQGLLAPYSIIRAGSTIYFYSNKGFYKIDPGAFPVQIGRERVDRTFLNNLDGTNLQLFIGAADPRTSYIYWAYKSQSGASGLYDSILGYDPALDKWFPLSVSGEYLLGISQPSITLEGLDALAPTPLTITGAANNGSGNVRLTLSAESNANFAIVGQNSITVYSVGGTTEANGTWKFQSGVGNPSAGNFTIVDSTHVDVGVSFVHSYTSGGQIGGSLDAMSLTLDNYPTSVQPKIAQFDSTHSQGFFTGSALQATFESAEQGTDGERIFVNGFRPITDAPTFFGSASFRETQQQAPTQTSEIAGNSRTGRCDLRQSTRYSRFKVRIPAATIWSFCAGVEPDTMQDGAT